VTIGEWLDRREPRPPAQLLESLKAALGPAVDQDAADSAAVFLVAAERMLRELVASRETGRPIAGDLLTIDALTTYAVESAAETLKNLPDFTDDAMARLANIVAPGSYPSPPKE
jgi:hypothetical protein